MDEPNGRHLVEAISLWRHLLDLKPDNLDARHQLLDLYVNMGFSNETLDGAETLLRRLPDDPAALRAKAIALVGLRRFPEAVAAIQRLNQLQAELPKLQADLDYYKINGLNTEQILAEARDLYGQWPRMTNDEKRQIAESLIEKIVVGANEIDITFSALPTSEEMTKSQHMLMDL